MTSANDDAARHKAKMAHRKAAQDAEVAAKTAEKGLLIVHTGKGKGKSTAAFGLMLRALGRGFRCGVVQFGKGAWQSGERTAVEKLGGAGARRARAPPPGRKGGGGGGRAPGGESFPRGTRGPAPVPSRLPSAPG